MHSVVVLTPTKVVTVAQMQALESASERLGVSTDTLMENAGLECARFVRQHMRGAAGRKVLLLIGPGNNGADGLVIARHLQRWGADTCCYVVRGRPAEDPKMVAALAYGVSVTHAEDDPDFSALKGWLSSSSAVVDAILGAGRYRALEGAVKAVAETINDRARSDTTGGVISIDLPTGVHPDTGEADDNTIVAGVTLALCYPKFGIANFPGAGRAGRIVVLDVGLHPVAPDGMDLPVEWMDAATVRDLLPNRRLDSHKGTYGHLLIIAGSRNFVGASSLAATAAHRVGAGLVTLATPKSVYPIVASKLTETIHLPLPEDGDGRVDASAARLIRERIAGYSALAVGCGLGWSDGTVEFIEQLLLNDGDQPTLPTVIDADGLNCLSRCDDWPQRLNAPAVLTPHPGEMARLLGLTVEEVQRDRLRLAVDYAQRTSSVVVLKGANTVVAGPDGRARLSEFSSAVLATAGTGDVLAGFIASLIGQGMEPFDAASAAVYLHNESGRALEGAMGAATAVASDVLRALPDVRKALDG